MSHCVGGVITEAKRGGNLELDGIGESETKNKAEVVAKDARPHHTGVYGNLDGNPAIATGLCSSCSSRSVVSWCLHFRAL